MTITRLELKNFRAARGLTLPTNSRRVLVAGINGAGKTSVREAVRWTLRGVCDGTDLKGAGAEVLVPTGASEASVALNIAGLGAVSRTFTEHGGAAFSVEGFTGSSGTQQQALLQKLGVSAAWLDACLETEYFSRLHHADGKALIMSLLDVKVPVEGIGSLTLDELDVRYKHAFEQRKTAKQKLTLIPPAPLPAVPDSYAALQQRLGDRDVIEACTTLLAALREQLTASAGTLGEQVGQRRALEQEQQRLQDTLNLGAPTDDAAGEVLERLRTELAALTGEPAQATPGMTLPLSAVAQLKTKAQTLADHKPSSGCVLDGTVPCKTPVKAFLARAEALRSEIAAVPTESLSGRDRTAVRDLERQIEASVALLQTNERQRAAVAAAHLRLPDVTAELAKLPDTTAAEADIAELKKRITRGEEVLGQARTYVQALQQHEQMKAQRAHLEQQLAELETRVEMLGPKGLRVQALGEAMGRFESAINRSTEAWGWQVSIVPEPWTVLANGRPVETYSRSERYRLGIAVQLAVAELSGLSFAIVDELDMLNTANRKRLLRQIHNSPLEQVLVLSTMDDEQAFPQPPEGWTFLRLAQVEGQSTVVETVSPQMQEA